MSEPDTGAVASYLIKLERDIRAARDEEIAAWCQAGPPSPSGAHEYISGWNAALAEVAAMLRSGRVPGAAQREVIGQGWAVVDIYGKAMRVEMDRYAFPVPGAAVPVDIVRRGDG